MEVDGSKNISNDNDTDYYSTDAYFALITSHFLVHSIVLISGVGILINVLACVALSRNLKHLPARLMFAITLAISDMLVSLSYFVDTLNFLDYYKFKGNPLYFRIVRESLFCLGKIAGLLTVLTLALDVLLAVKRPMHYRIYMSRRTGLMITSFIWATSFFITTLAKTMEYMHQQTTDAFFIIAELTVEVVVRASLSVVVLFAIFVIYLAIFNLLRNRRYLHRSRRRLSNRKAAITLFLIILTYIVFVLPRSLMQVIITEQNLKSFSIELMFHNLLLINNVMDPLIYSKRLPQVKRFFKTN